MQIRPPQIGNPHNQYGFSHTDPWLATGVVGESVPSLRTAYTFATQSYTDNRVICAGIEFKRGVQITKVQLGLGTTGLTIGANNDGHAWGGLADSSGTVLAVSTDTTSGTIAANGWATFSLASAYTPTADAAAYAIFNFAKGTGAGAATPTLQAVNVFSAAANRSPYRTAYTNSAVGAPLTVSAAMSAFSGVGFHVLAEALNT